MNVRVLLPLILAPFLHCVGDSTVPPPDDGGSDATTTDAPADSPPPKDAAQDVVEEAEAAPPPTGTFSSVLVLPDTTFAWSAMTFASNGDVLLGGDLAGSVVINSLTFTSNGGNDMLLIKLAANNGFKWAVSYGGTSDDRAYGVAMDAAGNAYVAGTAFCPAATGNVPFGNLKNIPCTHSGYLSIALKLNAADGGVAWVETFDTANGGNNQCESVAFDPSSGNVTVACTMQGNMSFVDTNNVTHAVTHANGSVGDPFLVQLDPTTGHVVKSAYIAGNASDGIGKILHDPTGNLYVVGGTSSSSLPAYVPADNTTSSFTLTPPNASNAGYVITLKAADWSLLWDHAYGTSAKSTNLNSAALDAAGDLYVMGTFNGTVDFGLGGITAAGSIDAVVAKLSSSGVISDLMQIGGANVGMASLDHVTVDATGNVAVAGYYQATAAGIKIGNTQLADSNGFSYAAYTAKLSGDLKNVLWAQGNSCPTANQNSTGITMAEVGIDPVTQQVVTLGTLFSQTTDFGDGKQVSRTNAGLFFLRRAP